VKRSYLGGPSLALRLLLLEAPGGRRGQSPLREDSVFFRSRPTYCRTRRPAAVKGLPVAGARSATLDRRRARRVRLVEKRDRVLPKNQPAKGRPLCLGWFGLVWPDGSPSAEGLALRRQDVRMVRQAVE
jgi:hypothetical protein